MKLTDEITCACDRDAERWGEEYQPCFEAHFRHSDKTIILCQPAIDELYSVLVKENEPSAWSSVDPSPWIELEIGYEGCGYCDECGTTQDEHGVVERIISFIEFPSEDIGLCNEHCAEFVELIRKQVEGEREE